MHPLTLLLTLLSLTVFVGPEGTAKDIPEELQILSAETGDAQSQLHRWPYFELTLRLGTTLSDSYNDPSARNLLSSDQAVEAALKQIEKKYLEAHSEKGKKAEEIFRGTHEPALRKVLEYLKTQAVVSVDSSSPSDPESGSQNGVVRKLFLAMPPSGHLSLALEVETTASVSKARSGLSGYVNTIVSTASIKPPLPYAFPSDPSQQRYFLASHPKSGIRNLTVFQPTAITLLDAPVDEKGQMRDRVRFVFAQDFLNQNRMNVYWIWTEHLRVASSEEQYERALNHTADTARSSLDQYVEHRSVSIPKNIRAQSRLDQLKNPRTTLQRFCGAAALLLKKIPMPKSIKAAPKTTPKD